jgi:hypothetical protein
MPDAVPPNQRYNPNPAFVPTTEQRWLVQVLHAHGIPLAAIARNVKDDGQRIDVKTLKKAFKEELSTAKLQVKAAIIAALVRSATQGNVTAQRYWLLTQGGPEWKNPWNDRDGEAPITAGAGETGTTIIIKGGLPPIDYNAPILEHEDIVPRSTNGSGNGRDHSD